MLSEPNRSLYKHFNPSDNVWGLAFGRSQFNPQGGPIRLTLFGVSGFCIGTKANFAFKFHFYLARTLLFTVLYVCVVSRSVKWGVSLSKKCLIKKYCNLAKIIYPSSNPYLKWLCMSSDFYTKFFNVLLQKPNAHGKFWNLHIKILIKSITGPANSMKVKVPLYV